MSIDAVDNVAAATWFVDRRERVVRAVDEFVQRHATSANQRQLLETALHALRRRSEQHVFCPFVHLPALVYAGIRDDDEKSIQLGVVTSLLYLGFDLLDDIADGDVKGLWSTFRPAEVQLAAAGLLGAVPILAMGEIDAPSDTIVELQRTMARGLMRMADGQQSDIRLATSREATPSDVADAAVGKGGEEFALFATLAARLAGASEATVASYANFARALGTGLQLASDCQDLFFDQTSRDLRNGTRSFPIALYLDSTSGDSRTAILRLLDDCRVDEITQRTVRQQLRDAGIPWQTMVFVELHRRRALTALGQASPRTSIRPLFDVPLQTIALLPT
jgi:geranylgeranyl pyrophosphate synthase